MCEPITLTSGIAMAGLALSAAGTATSVIGGMQQSGAASAAARYQAQVADNNAKIAAWQADDATKRGLVAEDKRNTLTSLQVSQQRAALGSGGSEVGAGTNVDIMGDTKAAGAFDALTIRSNAEREAYGYKVAGTSAEANARLQRQKADSADSSVWIGAGANLLSGASSVADKWASYKQKGLLS